MKTIMFLFIIAALIALTSYALEAQQTTPSKSPPLTVKPLDLGQTNSSNPAISPTWSAIQTSTPTNTTSTSDTPSVASAAPTPAPTPSMGILIVSPAFVYANTTTSLIFTDHITDPRVIPQSVNLQQTDANGVVLAVVASMS